MLFSSSKNKSCFGHKKQEKEQLDIILSVKESCQSLLIFYLTTIVPSFLLQSEPKKAGAQTFSSIP